MCASMVEPVAAEPEAGSRYILVYIVTFRMCACVCICNIVYICRRVDRIVYIYIYIYIYIYMHVHLYMMLLFMYMCPDARNM